MGLFSNKPASNKEVRGFGRGKTSSAKAAQQWAANKSGSKKSLAQQSKEWKAAQKKNK